MVASELASEPRDLLDADDAAPIIKLVNGLLSQAVKDRASDIHIEPFERDLVVRFRVDGMLYDVISPPKRFQAAITLARQGHVGPQHRGEAPAAGRPHPGPRSPAATSISASRRFRPPTANGSCCACSTARRRWSIVNLDRLGFSGDNLTRNRSADPSEPRHHPGDRPDRLRQDHDALRLPQPHQLAREEHHHDRGSDRVPAPRHRPDAGQVRRSSSPSPAACARSCARTPT